MAQAPKDKQRSSSASASTSDDGPLDNLTGAIGPAVAAGDEHVDEDVGAPSSAQFATLISTVLTTLLEEVPGNDGEKGAAVIAEAKRIREHYKNLKDSRYDRPELNFASAAQRFAYVYMLSIGHTSLITRFLDHCLNEPQWEEGVKSVKRVMAFGGGPGTEVLALSDFVARSCPDSRVTFRVQDLCRAWKYTWEEVFHECALPLTATYECEDVTKIDWKYAAESAGYHKFQLFTFVYFISALHHGEDGAAATRRLVENVYDLAPKGAFFLFVDNQVAAFVEPYETALNSKGAQRLQSFKKRVKFFKSGDVGSVLDRFKKIMGEPVRGGGVVCASLFVKP